MSQILVFDGDDTLWVSEPLYDAARLRVRALIESHGLNGGRWEELERLIDVNNVRRFGLSAQRFPTSCVEAYEAVAMETEGAVSQSIKQEVWTEATSVFRLRAPLVPGAEATLRHLATKNTLVLLTKGDSVVQRRRVAQSGLEDLFDFIAGVPVKSAKEFTDTLERVNAQASQSWSIGNSLASDINPALSIGMNAIWIDAHVWEYEKRETTPTLGRLVIARAIEEVPDILLHHLQQEAASH